MQSEATELEQLSQSGRASRAEERARRPSPALVDAVAERVYRLLRDDLRRLRERRGLGSWR